MKGDAKHTKDVALFTKQFKGSCRVCGKIGHKAIDCFIRPENKDKKEAYTKKMKEKREKHGNKGKAQDIQCYNCKKFGHYKSNCPDLKQNQRANNIEEDDSDNEVGLVCYTVD